MYLSQYGQYSVYGGGVALDYFTLDVPYTVEGQQKALAKTVLSQGKEIAEVGNIVESLNIGQMTDLRFPATQLKRGATAKPDFDFTNIGLLFPQNDETEAIYIVAQMPHSWEEGTTIYPHVHIRQAQATVPKFEMEYKIYDIGDTIPATFSSYVMDTGAVTYTSGTIAQLISGSGGIDMTGFTASAIILIKLYRQTGDGIASDVLVDEFNIHYYADKFGKDV